MGFETVGAISVSVRDQSLEHSLSLFFHNLYHPLSVAAWAKRVSLSTHFLASSILQSPLPHRLACKQTQLAIMMTNQPKYLCPLSFTLALTTARSVLFLYGSLCGSHLTRSQTVVIALHKHTSAPVMSPKHRLTFNVRREPSLWLAEEWYKHRSLRVLVSIFVWACRPTCSVNVMCVVSSSGKCVCPRSHSLSRN